MLIDGLQCGHFTRDVFSTLKEGGFTCVTSTLGFWEGSQASLDAIGRWRRLARANTDLMLIARTADDIARAHEGGRVAILPGFQNSTLFDGRIDYVELFADLGVRVVQLTYNNQNEAGGSCYEEHDNGLARFGREIVREMNRVASSSICPTSATRPHSTRSNGRRSRSRSATRMRSRCSRTSATRATACSRRWRSAAASSAARLPQHHAASSLCQCARLVRDGRAHGRHRRH